MRGEDSVSFWKRCVIGGSPPHARGRRRGRLSLCQRRRITPACAGKTGVSLVCFGVWRDHPRMRGEDSSMSRAASRQAGSPPHARGRHYELNRPEGWERITPACAGKTPQAVAVARCRSDHPRMRGEDMLPVPKFRRMYGSPPHARGRLLNLGVCRGDGGITPACAGKTRNADWTAANLGDHPRMRGEDSFV